MNKWTRRILSLILAAGFLIGAAVIASAEETLTLTILHDFNGGSGASYDYWVYRSSSAISFRPGGGYVDAPTRNGYDFEGWRFKDGIPNNTLYEHGIYYPNVPFSNPNPDVALTLVAQWKGKDYTVSFNANGGSVSPASKIVTFGSSYGTLPTPTRNGYTFNGWFTATSGGSRITSSSTVNLNGNQTLYAQWTSMPSNTYTVTLNPNGSILDSLAPISITVTNGGTYGTLPETWLPYHNFDGWYTAASGGTKITATTIVNLTANQTLYARMTPNSYTYPLNPNGGTVSPTSITVTFGSTYGTLPTPVRGGYNFDGWYRSGNEAFYGEAGGATKITSSTQVTSSTMPTVAENGLCARWVEAPDSYIVTYNANGGSISPTSTNVTAGTSTTLPNPTRSGYSCNGWYTATSGGTKIGNTGASYTPTASITLYAQWTAVPETYTVTVNSGTGGGSYAANATVNITAGTPQAGKVFDKWTTADDVTFANPNAVSTSFTMPAKNVTVTATYKVDDNSNPIKTIFSTKYESTFWNWFKFIVLFGWIWMWF
ncbi:MAG: InlB B-repeat-containing protein [Oscillospiraceae bacterium]|nr:InlB B-repeat-containing protein [Oscillospiraceae bacterium]